MKLVDRKVKLFFLAFFLGIFFWLFEAAIMSFVFHVGTFRDQVFSPSSHEIWQRVLVFTFISGFAFYAKASILREKHSADALKANEEKYRHLVELSPDAVFVQCEERIVFVNSVGVSILGAGDANEILGQPICAFLNADKSEYAQIRQQYLEEKGERLIEQELHRLDGKVISTEISAAPCVYGGEPAIQAIVRDITKRKQAEEELSKLRKAVERSGDVIFLTDRDGLITYINPEFRNVYGFTEGEVLNKVTPRILKSGLLSPQDYENFWENILENKVVKGTWINKCKDGRMIHVEGSANPIFDENKELIGFLAIQRDITDRRQAEEDIQQRNKELATLYTVAEILGRGDELDQILDEALGAVLKLDWLGGDTGGTLCLFDGAKQTFRLVADRGVPEAHPCLITPPKLEDCLCGMVVDQKDVVISNADDTDRPWYQPSLNNYRDICLPINAYGDIVGTLSIRLPLSQSVSDPDIDLLKSVTDQIGLAIKNAQLCQLNQEATLAERERIARELHDNMGQLLGYVNTKAMAVRLFIESGELDNAKKNLSQLEEAAQGLSVDVRKAILDLKTSGSGHLSGRLINTLENYITQFNRLSNLYVTYNICEKVDEIELNTETKLQILRIVQEALSNIRKHAKATQVSVSLNCEEDAFSLEIVDNGCGFELDTVEDADFPRFGLSSMRERAASIGGKFRLDTSPGMGTTVSVLRPIGENERV
jgi:PAS domain S-box-containing protein